MSSEKVKLALRYIFTGVTTYLVYFFLLLIVKFIPPSSVYYLIWPAVAFIIANIYNYLSHYFFTYKATSSHSETLVKFILVVAMGAIGLAVLVYVFENRVSLNHLILIEMLYGVVWPIFSAVLLTFFVFTKN